MRRDQVAGRLCAVVFVGCLSAHVFGQKRCQEPRVQTLKVVTEGSITDFWRVTKAEVSEDVTGVHMRLEVQNASDRVVAAGRFYAEYYDADQRRCLTAIFNLQGESGKAYRWGGSRRDDNAVYTHIWALSQL